ncbi:MAG: hypothetical protein AAF267_19300 [Deinococcota bacterium]
MEKAIITIDTPHGELKDAHSDRVLTDKHGATGIFQSVEGDPMKRNFKSYSELYANEFKAARQAAAKTS